MSVILMLATLIGSEPTGELYIKTQKTFESLAEQLPYLDLNAVLYRRWDHPHLNRDDERRLVHSRILNEVTDPHHADAALRSLLDHPDAKVRTLALVAIFDRENAVDLPRIFDLHTDTAKTFDGVAERRSAVQFSAFGPPGMGQTLQQQTVGFVAEKMVVRYLTHAGFVYGLEHPTEPGFKEYWEERKNRTHCASWFALSLFRATKGTEPLPLDAAERIRQLRSRIDRLPSEARTWTLLSLVGENGSEVLVSDDELVSMCQGLGREKLLQMLRRQIPNDDPDLQPGKTNNHAYERMQIFVSQHATQLLRHGDAAALLECEQIEWDYRSKGVIDPLLTGWWSVAAASLAPENAKAVLHSSLARFDGRYRDRERALVCAALWRIVGESETSFLVNWFFKESPQRGTFGVPRSLFIEQVASSNRGKEMIAAIIRDPRFDDLDWPSLVTMVRAVNQWVATPVVTDEEQQEARHPLGAFHFDCARDEAMLKYPEETIALLNRLEDWRFCLRASVPFWLPN